MRFDEVLHVPVRQVEDVDTVVRIDRMDVGIDEAKGALVRRSEFRGIGLFIAFASSRHGSQDELDEFAVLRRGHICLRRMTAAFGCHFHCVVDVVESVRAFLAQREDVVRYDLDVRASGRQCYLVVFDVFDSAFLRIKDGQFLAVGAVYAYVVVQAVFEARRHGVSDKVADIAGSQVGFRGRRDGVIRGGYGDVDKVLLHEERYAAGTGLCSSRAVDFLCGVDEHVFNILCQARVSVITEVREFGAVFVLISFLDFVLRIGYHAGLLEELDVIRQAFDGAARLEFVVFHFEVGVILRREQAFRHPREVHGFCRFGIAEFGVEQREFRGNVSKNRTDILCMADSIVGVRLVGRFIQVSLYIICHMFSSLLYLPLRPAMNARRSRTVIFRICVKSMGLGGVFAPVPGCSTFGTGTFFGCFVRSFALA